MEPKLAIWKFLVPSHKWTVDPTDESREDKGCVAACVAMSREQALEHLRRYAAHQGYDIGWLRAATVIELPIEDGTTCAWAQV